MLISNNLPERKSYIDSNNIQNENARLMQRFLNEYLEAHIDRNTCLHPTSLKRESCTHCDINTHFHTTQLYIHSGETSTAC